MKKNKTKLKTFILLFIGLICIFAIFRFLLSKHGTAYVTEQITDHYLSPRTIQWEENEGNLVDGTKFMNLSIKNIDAFPKPNELTIQSLELNIQGLSLEKIKIDIQNAKLALPNSDPILLFGDFSEGKLNFNLFTQSISDTEIKSLIKISLPEKVKGTLQNVDLYVKGSIEEPQIQGEFLIDEGVYDQFKIQKASCQFDIVAKEINKNLSIQGPLTFFSGMIQGNKTARMELSESQILFEGMPDNPHLKVKAKSQVEKFKINLTINGELKNPHLQVDSTPELPKEKILLALATNKTWEKTENTIKEGKISIDLAKDFIDYFLFGGTSHRFTEKLGLKSLSVNYNNQEKGVAVSKDLSNKLEGKYALEKKTTTTNESQTTQKIGGEYKLTNTMTLEVNKEITNTDTTTVDNQTKSPVQETEFLFKYKKSF